MPTPPSTLDRYRGRNGRFTDVVLKLKVFELEAEDVLNFRIDLHGRQRMGFTGQEKFYLLAVVRVQVAVAPSPDELTSDVVGHLCNHHGQ